MSLALTDLLIEVAEPAKLQLYRSDPEAFMSAASLTEDDKEALRSGRLSRIRMLANAVSPEDESELSYRQFGPSRTATFNPALIEVEPMVEVHVQAQENVAAAGTGQLFVDKSGQLFRRLVV